MTEVVVVGGGVAGAAAAARLAADGREVLVLEREVEYTDRVRGEGMVPWGLEAARALGLADAVLQAPGASCMTALVAYDELVAIDDAQRRARSLAEVLPGVPGLVAVGHPSCVRLLPTLRPPRVRSSFVASSTWRCIQVRRPKFTTRSTVRAIGSARAWSSAPTARSRWCGARWTSSCAPRPRR